MNLTLLASAFDAPLTHLIQPLGWTLLHSLWQGLLVWLGVALALTLLRRAAAATRYAVGCAGLVLLLLLPIITFARVYAPPTPVVTTMSNAVEAGPPITTITSIDAAAPALADATPVADAPTKPWTTHARQWCETRLPWCVALWLAGVLFCSLRLLLNWTAVRRWRARSVTPVARQIHALADDLAERLGVRRAVRVLESTLADAPTTLGWLQPVILLPVTAVTGLTHDQLRALLAHELAHVKRCDYLVNLLQCVLETLLFYHPAGWWISKRVRREREHCCDDIAVRLCASPAAYADALAAAAETARSDMRLGVAATGGLLLERVQRLLGVARPQRPIAHWFVGLAALAFCAATSLGWYSAAAEPPSAADAASETQPATAANNAGASVSYEGDFDLNKEVPLNLSAPVDEPADRLVLTSVQFGTDKRGTITAALNGTRPSSPEACCSVRGRLLDDAGAVIGEASTIVEGQARHGGGGMYGPPGGFGGTYGGYGPPGGMGPAGFGGFGGSDRVRLVFGAGLKPSRFQITIARATPEELGRYREEQAKGARLREQANAASTGEALSVTSWLLTFPPDAHFETPTDGELLSEEARREFMQRATINRRTNVMAAPRLCINHGEKGSLLVGQQREFVTSYRQQRPPEGAGAMGGAGPIPYEPVTETFTLGLSVEITPTLTTDGEHAVLDITIEKSELVDVHRKPFEGAPAGQELMVEEPEIRKETLKASHVVPLGQTFVCPERLGGPDGEVLLIMVERFDDEESSSSVDTHSRTTNSGETPTSLEVRPAQREPREGWTELAAPDGGSLYVAPQSVLTGDDFTAAVAWRQDDATRSLLLLIAPESAERLHDYTSKHRGEIMAIVIDGDIVSAPTIFSPVRDRVVISASNDAATAERFRKIAATVKQFVSCQTIIFEMEGATVGLTMELEPKHAVMSSDKQPQFALNLGTDGDERRLRTTLDGWVLEVDGETWLLQQFTTALPPDQTLSKDAPLTPFATLQFHTDAEHGLHVRQMDGDAWVNSFALREFNMQTGAVKDDPKQFTLTPGKHALRLGARATDLATSGDDAFLQRAYVFSPAVEIEVQ